MILLGQMGWQEGARLMAIRRWRSPGTMFSFWDNHFSRRGFLRGVFFCLPRYSNNFLLKSAEVWQASCPFDQLVLWRPSSETGPWLCPASWSDSCIISSRCSLMVCWIVLQIGLIILKSSIWYKKKRTFLLMKQLKNIGINLGKL